MPLIVGDDYDDIRIIHILPIGNHCQLILLRISRHKRISAPEQSTVILERIVTVLPANRGATLDAHVAEPAFLVFLFEADIQHLLPAPVLDARSAGLLAFPVDNPDLVHHRGRQVIQCRTLVTEKEGASAHGEFVDFLAIELHLPVVSDFHTRHTLEQILQHRIGSNPEGRSVEFNSILFDDDRIAHIGDHRSLQELFVHLQPDGAQIHLFLTEEALYHNWLVPHHLHVESIIAERDFVQLGFSIDIRQREIRDRGVL